MNKYPLVSVITASYNMGQYVGMAIDSILTQEYPNIEAIVIDDGSTDDTQKNLTKYRCDPRVKIIYQENAGQTKAKNRGLKEAKGKYIAFCDADDQWMPNKLNLQIPSLENYHGFAVSYSDFIRVDSMGNQLPTRAVKRYSGKITSRLLMDNFIPFNTVVLHKDILEDVGPFDESLTMSIDYDLWLRVSVKYSFIYLPLPLIKYRVWQGQMSHRTDERFNNLFKVMNKFFANNSENLSSSEIRKNWANTYVNRGRWRVSQKKYRLALQDFYRAFLYRPYYLPLWKSLAKLMLNR